ncbi:Uncharacterized protein FKW44_004951, partial [Caligus rogercresseyi]
MVREFLADIGEKQYSLVIDESTDVAATKQLCVVVRYFSTKLTKIVSSFLGL